MRLIRIERDNVGLKLGTLSALAGAKRECELGEGNGWDTMSNYKDR